MLVQIAKFFRTGELPIDPAETVELYTFMEAAAESKGLGGAAVSMANVLKKAQADADSLLQGKLK